MKFSFVINDVETDGPAPGLFSMIAFAAVVVEESLHNTFGPVYLKPISENFDPEYLAITGYSRERTLNFSDPYHVMLNYATWVSKIKNPKFISDNNGFDWMFINYYFWKFLGKNPYGFSSQNLNSFYKGLTKNFHASFKNLKITQPDHNPLNDALGCAEAMLEMCKQYNMKI